MSTTQSVPPAAGTVELAARAVEVTKTYGTGPAARTALDGVKVGFGRGRFSAVMGPSGSGKSTLLHCLAGLEPVDQGRVHLGEVDLTRLDERRLTRLRRDRVGFIFQSFNLLPTLTAAEHIALPLAIAGRRPDRAMLERVLDAVGLRDRLRHRPAELSGGEQQRVAAGHSDEVVFLADGRVVDRMAAPTAGRVLDAMKALGG
ncbi:MAG TPA: ATP-binding cassette domain-containing protein [Actinomycetes bacterium]|nr:ATP-binding cassette domain-containing protein [Actinomycetes bacterium]